MKRRRITCRLCRRAFPVEELVTTESGVGNWDICPRCTKRLDDQQAEPDFAERLDAGFGYEDDGD